MYILNLALYTTKQFCFQKAVNFVVEYKLYVYVIFLVTVFCFSEVKLYLVTLDEDLPFSTSFFNASLLLRECFVSLENTSVKKTPVQKSFGWAHLLSCVPSFAVTLGLYFPRKEYFENVYIDEPAGMPLLRIHALKDSPEEVAHFHLCQNLIISRGRHENNWFQIKEKTGLLYLSKSLDREDFNMLCKYEKTSFSSVLKYVQTMRFLHWKMSIKFGKYTSALSK